MFPTPEFLVLITLEQNFFIISVTHVENSSTFLFSHKRFLFGYHFPKKLYVRNNLSAPI